MAAIDSYNMIKIAEDTLLNQLKERVINNIVDRMVLDFIEKDT